RKAMAFGKAEIRGQGRNYSEPPMTILKRLVAIAALLCLASMAHAAYPERPITLIVAYPPGGGTDLVARALAPFVEKYLGGGAKIVVVNRAGAGGEVGFAALANSPADGYTIGFVNTPPLLTIPIERQAQFHWQRYDYIGNIIDDPCNFSVHAETPIMVAAINIGEALQYQKGGTPLRNLVQMSPARTNLAPELPTAREQGFDIEMSSLRGMAAPKGLPADIRERLVAAVQRATADPEFQAQAVKFFAPLRYLAPAQYEAIVREADVMYRAMWR